LRSQFETVSNAINIVEDEGIPPMVALVQVFVDVVGVLWTFVNTYMVPATPAGITIIHVAIWTPVVIGLLTMVSMFIKSLWGRKKAG
jgi:hypothetical protein